MTSNDRFFQDIKLASQAWIEEAFNSVKDKSLTLEDKATAINNYLTCSARQQQENIKQELLNSNK